MQFTAAGGVAVRFKLSQMRVDIGDPLPAANALDSIRRSTELAPQSLELRIAASG
jgi:hypothetical protein